MSRRRWTDDQLRSAVITSGSKAEVLRKLGLRPTGGNYAQFDKFVNILGLNIDHFTGSAWNKGKNVISNPGFPLSVHLVEGRFTNSHRLRKRLIREGYFKHKCYRCDLSEWNGKKIPLELEHINGNKSDNRLENLTILCPNCHAQTPTYRGKNKAPLAKRQTRSV